MEVLQEIFLYCCFSDDEVWGDMWVLGRVSRRWRAAALGYGKLWSRIWITRDLLSYLKVRDPLPMIDAWLTRSRTCALEINFEGFFRSEYPSPYAMFAPLLQHCHRWQSLEIWNFNPDIFAALNSMRGNFQMLRSLDLFFYERDRVSMTIDAFSDAQNLSSVHLSLDGNLRINILSSSLTSLTVSTSNGLRNLNFPRLNELTIEEEDYYLDNLDDDEDEDDGDDSKTLSNILGFIRRSRCTLTFLSLCAAKDYLGLHEVKRIFDLLPKLKQLVLRLQGDDDFVTSLSISDKSIPLPHLDKLKLSYSPPPTDLVISLSLDIVEARYTGCSSTAKLTEFTLTARHISLSPALVSKAKRLHEGGLLITFKTWGRKVVFPVGRDLYNSE
ncbi:hypothetical protein AX16_008241 [Volvariella volvacea WC 439]|nr:hypothetical protein AX16_008241 [Volvariella volvacea WC 439]